MKKTVLILACLWTLIPGTAGAEAPIKQGERLDLNRCIAIALERHPGIQAAAGNVRAGEGRIGQARSGFYPQISGSAGYSRTEPVSSAKGGASTEVFNSYSTGLSLNQNLYDFGRTSTQVKVQEFNRDASQSDLENTRTLICFGVKQAYYALLQAGRNREVAREVVEQFRQHLDQAKAFFEVGVKPKFDVTKAEVDLSTAKLNLQRTENAYRLAVVALNNAIGLPEAPQYEVVDYFSFEPEEIDLDATLRKAYDRRPDLRAIAVRKKALEESVELARKGYYPFVTGSAGYSWGGSDLPLDRGWNVGAQLNVPIFSGFSTKHEISEAQANLEVLTANETVLRQEIHQNVKQAWINLQEAADRVTTAAISIRQAEENLDLANGRYASGVGSPIEVTDALVAKSNVQTAQISAIYDYKLAKASLEKAMGEQ